MPQSIVHLDYVNAFYVAGHLVASGRAEELYPEANASSFAHSRFDKAAHTLLPLLPQSVVAAYMYSPIVAWIFAPLSYLDAKWSLVLWQGLSLVAFAVSCRILGRIGKVRATDIFVLSFLFFPAIISLWIGQVCLVFGVLPLCCGYYLLTTNRPFWAGVAWSCLLLKPQYMPAVVLVALALAVAGKLRCFGGIALGCATLSLANLIVLPAEITKSWLRTFEASDAVIAGGAYTVPIHIVTSLPSNLLFLFPASRFPLLKLPVYALAAALWSVGVRQGVRLVKADIDPQLKISLSLVIGILLLPLVSPHMLYYDLSLLIPTCVILGKKWVGEGDNAPRNLYIAAWVSISLYLPLILTVKHSAFLPVGLDLLLLGLCVAILIMAAKIPYRSSLHFIKGGSL
jgi:hypothetical protein